MVKAIAQSHKKACVIITERAKQAIGDRKYTHRDGPVVFPWDVIKPVVEKGGAIFQHGIFITKEGFKALETEDGIDKKNPAHIKFVKDIDLYKRILTKMNEEVYDSAGNRVLDADGAPQVYSYESALAKCREEDEIVREGKKNRK